jgi:hypothetical protein
VRLRRLAAAAGLAVLGGAAVAAAAPPTGDPKGLALLDRVHGAYRGVPAVSIQLKLGTSTFVASVVLDSGVDVAERLVIRTPSGTTTSVARRGGPTFVRDAGKKCWRRLAASDPKALDDLGLRFPGHRGIRVRALISAPTTWRVQFVSEGRTAYYLIDKKSLLVRSIVFTENGRSAYVEHVRTLGAAPTIPSASPVC